MLKTTRLLKLSNNLLQLDFELLNSIVKSIIINDKLVFSSLYLNLIVMLIKIKAFNYNNKAFLR